MYPYQGWAATTFNDVWSSSDGKDWKQETAKAPWSARALQGVVVVDNKLWILGGTDSNYNYTNDVWSSSDGANWTQSPCFVPWSPRHSFGAAVFQNRIYIMGGENDTSYNDVWYLPVSGYLMVNPVSGLSASGTRGGSFTPAGASYTLTNTGSATLAWTAAKTSSWLTLSKANGTLAAGASDTVTVTINATAKTLAAGTYGDTVTFTNTTNGQGNTSRAVTLRVQRLSSGARLWRVYP